MQRSVIRVNLETRNCLAPMPSITLRFIAATAVESFTSIRSLDEAQRNPGLQQRPSG